MRPLGSLALVAASAGASALLVVLSHGLSTPAEPPLAGLYEPLPSQAQRAGFGFEVMFLDWNDAAAVPRLERFLQRAHRRQRLPLLTLEPFADRGRAGRSGDLLGDVLAGRHDAELRAIARTLAAHPGVVLLRFAHEMDKPGQYPWSYRDPGRYRTLYHSVHARMSREGPRNLRWVWSPAGTPQADRFWPGDRYVDLIGISIYASRAWSPDRSLESFERQVRQKRWLQQRFGRPLLLAEVGVSGSAEDQRRWLREAVASLSRFPEVCGLVYFQAPQPSWMPLVTGHEDWALKPAVLDWWIGRLPLPPRRGLPCVEA